MAEATLEGPARPSLVGLGERFAREELRSSARVLIVLALGVNRRLTFTDLLELTHVAKGSLSYHIRQLETAGLVGTATVFTFRGQRMVVSITASGGELYRRLVEELRALPPSPIGDRTPTSPAPD